MHVGDLLVFGAAGGHVRSGAEVLERLGPFVPGAVGTDGQVLSPMGAPNTLLFLARSPGSAHIEVVRGDPWGTPGEVQMLVTVEP